MSFDLERALRRVAPQRRVAPAVRPDAVTFLAEPITAGPQLLLDTCVYIDVLQGKTSPALDMLLETRLINHSAVCLAELTHLFGRLDPADPRTKGALREISRVVADIPTHRLGAPSTQAYGEAGMLAGAVERLRGRAERAKRGALLNDALIFIEALTDGQAVLTRNVRDFGAFLQLAPQGRIIFYRV